MSNPLGYTEQDRKLQIRIHANKQYTNFQLESWLEKELLLPVGSKMMDIGCGNGNFLPPFDRKLGMAGLYVGVDKSMDLLTAAKSKITSCQTLFLRLDMDGGLPFPENTFDLVFSSFAIYYANSVEDISWDMLRILKPGGWLVLLGPTQNNAKELMDFDAKAFGKGRAKKAEVRSLRLEKEFAPIIRSLCPNFDIEHIPIRLTFPDKTKFIEYYMATLLFEESIKETGHSLSFEQLINIDLGSLYLSKEVVALKAVKG